MAAGSPIGKQPFVFGAIVQGGFEESADIGFRDPALLFGREEGPGVQHPAQGPGVVITAPGGVALSVIGAVSPEFGFEPGAGLGKSQVIPLAAAKKAGAIGVMGAVQGEVADPGGEHGGEVGGVADEGAFNGAPEGAAGESVGSEPIAGAGGVLVFVGFLGGADEAFSGGGAGRGDERQDIGGDGVEAAGGDLMIGEGLAGEGVGKAGGAEAAAELVAFEGVALGGAKKLRAFRAALRRKWDAEALASWAEKLFF